ncbi:MAG: DUF2304 domain-containing protein [Tissierellia bacterium]|nr:DUF2304 domain-containing protein [Tissierellia bacterium]
MDLLTQIWIIALSVSIIIYLFEKIRKQKYIVKFSLPWFLTFFIIIVLAIFPILIDLIAIILGIREPTNAIFFIAIGILVNNIINLSFSMSESKKQSIRMAQEIALLKKGFEINGGNLIDSKLPRKVAFVENKNIGSNNEKFEK